LALGLGPWEWGKCRRKSKPLKFILEALHVVLSEEDFQRGKFQKMKGFVVGST
jgi:hypothetical protein